MQQLPRRWSVAVGTLVGLALVVAGCCSTSESSEVAAGASATSPGATSAPAPTSSPAPTSAPASTTAPSAPADAPVGPGTSPVEGLDPLALRDAVEAPVSGAGRRSTSPVADSVTLPDGRRVWRVRIPGSFPARSAEGTVAVGGVVVGRALPTADLSALVAVTSSSAPLVAGAPVTLRWGGEAPQAVGTLEVLR